RIQFQLDDGSRQDLTVRIPAGIRHGARLRLAGKGAPSPFGGAPGDLDIVVNIAPHEVVRREGDHVLTDLTLKISEALLGCTKEVQTPEGPRRIRVPPGVKGNTRVRLKGLGFPSVGGSARGDLFAVIRLDLPKNLTVEQRK